MTFKYWTDDDNRILKRLWGTFPASAIGEHLGRKRNSIIGRAHRLGLDRMETPKGWTPEDVALLTDMRVRKRPIDEIMKALAPRTQDAVRSKLREVDVVLKKDEEAKVEPTAALGKPNFEPVTDPAWPKAKRWELRKFGECTFPVSVHEGYTFSCCAEAQGTYCKAHRRIMYDRRTAA